MRRILSILFLLAAVLVLFGCEGSAADQKKMPKSGSVADYVIVRSETASIYEVRAAILLRDRIEKLSGIQLPIIKDGAPSVSKEIVVGRSGRSIDSLAFSEDVGTGGYFIVSKDLSYLISGEGEGIYDGIEYFLFCLSKDDKGNLFLPKDISVRAVADAVTEASEETLITVAP